MTVMQQMAAGQANAQIPFNENFETVSAVAIFGKRQAASSGLVWGYYGGLYLGNDVANGQVTLTDNADNWIVVLRSTGVVSASTSDTNATDATYATLYKATTAGGVVLSSVDMRIDTNGLLTPIDPDLTAIGAALARVTRRTSGIATGECLATSSNVLVDTQPAGSACSVYNDSSSAIQLNEDTGITLRMAGSASTGTRIVAGRGMVTIWYNSTTEAIVGGSGLS